MKADYVHKDSRTLEEEYNKGYERGMLDTLEENQRLDKENQALKEQVDYLRRSIERKEEKKKR